MLPIPTPPLSALLRDATREERRRAEERPLVRSILAGTVDRDTYALLLRNLHTVYEGLEAGLGRAAATDPALAAFAPAELRRTRALEEDLRTLHGAGWDALPTASATRRFRTRLDGLADTDPLLLVAHAYVRYLGDLSGGTILGRRVAEALDLVGDAGLSFHRFPDIGDVSAFKDRYRAALDALAERGREDDLLSEARHAFESNRELFDGVERLRRSTPS